MKNVFPKIEAFFSSLPNRWFYLVSLSTLYLILGLNYGFSLDDPRYFDSRYMLTTSILDGWANNVTFLESLGHLRYIGRWVHWGLYQLFGLETNVFRLLNLCLHAFNGTVLYFLVLSLFSLKNRARWIAFMVTFTFVMNPAALYAVHYVIQTYLLLATSFSLLAIYLFWTGLKKNAVWYGYGASFCYYLAVMSKEQAILLPIILVGLFYGVKNWSWQRHKRWIGPFLLMVITALMVFLTAQHMLAKPYEPNAKQTIEAIQSHTVKTNPETALQEKNLYPQSVINQTGFFFRYLYLWMVPDVRYMSLSTPLPFYRQLWGWPQSAYFGLFILYGILGFLLLRRRGFVGLVGWSFLFPFISFFPELSTVRFHENFFLYRSYLWMPGFFIAFAYWFLRGFEKGVFGRFVSGFIILACFQVAAVQHRLQPFENRISQWQDVVDKIDLDDKLVPASYQALGNLAAAYGDERQFDQSIRYYKLAGELNPDFDKAWFGIGASLMFKGDLEASIPYFKKAIKVNPLYKDAYFLLGRVYEGLGRVEEASYQYELATHLLAEKWEEESLQSLGDTSLKLKKYSKAIKAYSKVLKKFPENIDARHNLAVAYTHSGQAKEAIEQFNLVLAVKPKHAKAYYNQGNTFLAIKDYKGALKRFEKAYEIQPQYWLAVNGMAQCYLQMGDFKKAQSLFETVLKNKPDFTPAQIGLKMVQKRTHKK